MAASEPLVSVVVLNWNGLADTKICLEHLRKLDYPNYEIVVVDNGSHEDSKKYLSQLSGIVYVDNPFNRGFTGGHIDGLRASKGEYVVLLNNDAVMRADYLKKALPLFDDPQVAAVGGRAYFWNESCPLLEQKNPFYSYQKVDVHTGEAFSLESDFAAVQEVNNVSGSAVVVRRSVIDKIGYLYDPFFAYFEETDLFARCKRAGYKVLYSPELQIWHRNGGSSGASEGSYFFYYQIFRNRCTFAVRNFESSFLRHFLAYYFRLGARSLAISILKPHASPNMNRAYAKAAARNFIKLPALLLNRHQLTKQLGVSHYNHQIYHEQTGISIVIDCQALSVPQLHSLAENLRADTNPLHEYVFITPLLDAMPETLTGNQRAVLDRGYFAAEPVNLGCLAARFDWLIVCQPESTPAHISTYTKAIENTLGSGKQVVSLDKKALAITKRYYQHIGGLQGDTLDKAFAHTAKYALSDNQLSIDSAKLVISKHEKDTLLVDKRYNDELAKDRSLGRFGKLKARYYRLFQLVILLQWLCSPRIPLRLKLARLRNLLLFTLRLRRVALAAEIKHMRNEVVIYGKNYRSEDRNKVIKSELQQTLQKPSDLPVFIICFERVESLRTLVKWLESVGLRKIIFVDNDSSYKPLLDYYGSTPYQVLRLYRNIGHTSPWNLDIIRTLLPNSFYIVTDPDVIPTETCKPDVLSHLLHIHGAFPAHQKVGLGLKIDDLPTYYPLRASVIEWERQFWKHSLADGVYEAGVDTTFAIYKPYTYRYMLHPSLRTGEPYTARHLPWYVDPKESTEEEQYYRARANANVTSWNVDTLPERYQKEMSR